MGIVNRTITNKGNAPPTSEATKESPRKDPPTTKMPPPLPTPKELNDKAVVEAQIEAYRALDRTLNDLILALKKDRAAMIHSRKTKEEVINRLVDLSRGTPLAAANAEMSPPTLKSVRNKLSTVSKASENKYDSTVIDYAIDWEKTLTSKFESELKELDEARRTLEHYQKKMGTLTSSKEKVEAKDKQLSPKQADKLQRNQEKLEQAEHEYQKHMFNLGLLSDDLVKTSWTYLYPLLVKLLEFDPAHAEEKAIVLAECHDVLKNLNSVAASHGLPLGSSSTSTIPTTPKTIIPMTPGVVKAMEELGPKKVASAPDLKLASKPEEDSTSSTEGSETEHKVDEIPSVAAMPAEV